MRDVDGKEKVVRRRQKRNYKFTEKTQSKRGIASLFTAIVSMAIFAAVVVDSFWNRGSGSIYLGSIGIFSMLLAVTALVLAVGSLREENSFKLFPYLATFFSFLTTGVWVALYVLGFMMQ